MNARAVTPARVLPSITRHSTAPAGRDFTRGTKTTLSGHSIRVGATQDLLALNIDLASVMQAGRWKTSEMVARYTRRLSARRSAAVQIADRRVGF